MDKTNWPYLSSFCLSSLSHLICRPLWAHLSSSPLISARFEHPLISPCGFHLLSVRIPGFILYSVLLTLCACPEGGGLICDQGVNSQGLIEIHKPLAPVHTSLLNSRPISHAKCPLDTSTHTSLSNLELSLALTEFICLQPNFSWIHHPRSQPLSPISRQLSTLARWIFVH